MSSLPCPPAMRERRSDPLDVPLRPLRADDDDADEDGVVPQRRAEREEGLEAWYASWVHAPSEPPGGR